MGISGRHAAAKSVGDHAVAQRLGLATQHGMVGLPSDRLDLDTQPLVDPGDHPHGADGGADTPTDLEHARG